MNKIRAKSKRYSLKIIIFTISALALICNSTQAEPKTHSISPSTSNIAASFPHFADGDNLRYLSSRIAATYGLSLVNTPATSFNEKKLLLLTRLISVITMHHY